MAYVSSNVQYIYCVCMVILYMWCGMVLIILPVKYTPCVIHGVCLHVSLLPSHLITPPCCIRAVLFIFMVYLTERVGVGCIMGNVW